MAAAPRVVIDPGSHAVLNLGDISMLQVAVERLRAAWPEARIGVLTTDAERLALHCPGAQAVPAAGRYAWMADGARHGLRGRARLSRDADARAYRRALRRTDLFLVSGRGSICDAFAGESHELLTELEFAASLGLRTAMMGQGIGPLADRSLAERAAAVLPAVDLIAVREPVTALPLLESLGVEADRVSVTGDDALEPAWTAARDPSPLDRIGLNVRAADYAGIDEPAARRVADAVRETAGRLGASVASVPISVHPSEADAHTFERLLGDAGPAPTATRDAIVRAGTCRVVVTGSYHAAVFALGQGRPAIGIAASDYYRSKFHGLAAQYSGALPVLEPGEADFRQQLAETLEDAWESESARRADLLAATERQVEAGHAAYARLEALLRG
jgi:polysaccharide pyruvyl transferase WcaK-like protein